MVSSSAGGKRDRNRKVHHILRVAKRNFHQVVVEVIANRAKKKPADILGGLSTSILIIRDYKFPTFELITPQKLP